MNNNWYRTGFYIALALNVLLLATVYKLKFMPPATSAPGSEPLPRPTVDLTQYMARTQLPDVTVIDVAGNGINARELVVQRAPALVVFFSPADCHTCLEEKELWRKIARTTPFRVFAIVANPDLQEYRTWETEIGIPVETFVDTSFAIFDHLDFRVRPVKVLFNSRGEAIWADKTRLGPEEEEQFWKDFAPILSAYR